MLGFLGGLFSALFSFLKCLVLFLLGALLAGLEDLFNLALAGLMAIVGPLLSLLPSVTLPSLSLGSFVAQANYFIPISDFLTVAAIVIPVLLVLPLVRTGLRWLRVVG